MPFQGPMLYSSLSCKLNRQGRTWIMDGSWKNTRFSQSCAPSVVFNAVPMKSLDIFAMLSSVKRLRHFELVRCFSRSSNRTPTFKPCKNGSEYVNELKQRPLNTMPCAHDSAKIKRNFQTNLVGTVPGISRACRILNWSLVGKNLHSPAFGSNVAQDRWHRPPSRLIRSQV